MHFWGTAHCTRRICCTVVWGTAHCTQEESAVLEMTKLMCCDRAKTAGKIQIISDQTPYVDGLISYEMHEKVLRAIVQFPSFVI